MEKIGFLVELELRLGFIGNYIIGKVSGENSDKRSKVQDNNNASDGNIITGGKTKLLRMRIVIQLL